MLPTDLRSPGDPALWALVSEDPPPASPDGWTRRVKSAEGGAAEAVSREGGPHSPVSCLLTIQCFYQGLGARWRQTGPPRVM